MSPYFPPEEERLYWCKNCGLQYEMSTQTCLVNHPPGTCCHVYEKPVAPVPPGEPPQA